MKKYFFIISMTLPILAQASWHFGVPLKPHRPGELILCLQGISPTLPKSKTISLEPLASLSTHQNNKSLANERRMVLIKTSSDQEASQLAQTLALHPSVQWISPNFMVTTDPRESDVADFNDPLYKDQVHHRIMKSAEAFTLTRGSKDVIVALTDDGAEYTHPDLLGALWQNPDEIENSEDDDGNGLVDDLLGWDFSSDLNSILPHPEQGHGTHLAGIISAQENNGEGVVGAAPGITLLPIKFYGGPNSWTSAVVAKSFDYAIKKGARIISTSYGTDWFDGDLVYQEIVNYAATQGVILFNSAGNNRQENPARLKNDLVLFVSATNTLDNIDRKTGFSNYGYGVDIAAPGEQIYSTYLGGSYRAESGTSMATPLAASVAALIWSYYPDYNYQQVIARLLATSDAIDSINSRYAFKVGVGRINSWRALSEEVPPPQFRGLEGVSANSKIKKTNTLRLILKNTLLSSSVDSGANSGVNHPQAFELKNLTTGVVIPFESQSFHQLLSNKIDFTFPTLPVGKYQFTAHALHLIDPFGQSLDGNGDGIEGDDFILPFEVANSYSY